MGPKAQSYGEIFSLKIFPSGVVSRTTALFLAFLSPSRVITPVIPLKFWVEAMAFAWLAYQNIHQQTGNLPSVTGAKESVILGTLTNHAA